MLNHMRLTLATLFAAFSMSSAYCCTFTLGDVVAGIGLDFEQLRSAEYPGVAFLPRLTEQEGDTPISSRHVDIQYKDEWQSVQVDHDGALHLDFSNRHISASTPIRVRPDCGRGLGLGVALAVPLPNQDTRIEAERIRAAADDYETFRKRLPFLKRSFAPRLKRVRFFDNSGAPMRCHVVSESGLFNKSENTELRRLPGAREIQCPRAIVAVRLDAD